MLGAVCELEGSDQEMAQWVNTFRTNTVNLVGENPFLKAIP